MRSVWRRGLLSGVCWFVKFVELSQLSALLILYTFEPADSSASLHGDKKVTGRHFTLTEEREDDGPWFPKVLCEEDADAYSFCAGRWQSAPDLRKHDNFPDGCWLALSFDRGKDVLIARSDPFLLSRWYYTQSGNKLYLTNSLLFLKRKLGSAVEVNWQSADSLLRFGYLRDKETPLRKVFSLRSGETLRCQNGQLSLEQVRVSPPPRKVRPVTSAEIYQRLSVSVQQELEGMDRVVIPLSGGMDSRVLLALALQVLPREAIHTVTFGHPTSLDFRIGRQVAQDFGVTNQVMPMDSRPLGEQVKDNFPVGEGMHWCVPEYPVGPYHEALPDHSLILSGYIGDVVFGSFEPDDEIESAQSASDLLLETIESVPKLVLKRLLPNNTSSDNLVSENGSPLLSYESFIYGSHQMNRTNFALFVHRHKYCYAAPFVHAKVLETAYALDARDRRGERAFFGMVREHLPDLWRLPLKSSFGYPPEFRYARRTMLVRTWRRVMANLDAVIGARLGTILYRHPRLNYAHPREWMASPHREFVIQCIERLIATSPLEKTELLRLRDGMSRGRAIDGSLIKGLVTLAQWVEAYGDRD